MSTSELKIPVRTLSQIGASHVRQNKPNQDHGKSDYLTFGDEQLYILSVSDGHGSERSFRSDQGSRIAVESTIKVLKEIFFKNLSINELETQSDFIIGRIVHYWKQEVKQHFDNNDLSELEKSLFNEQNDADEQLIDNIERAYGATLILAVVTPNYILYLQIGDGNIYTIESSGKSSIPFQPDLTIIGNDTHSLCEKDVKKHIQIKIVPHDNLPNFVFLTTDGLPNSFATDEEFSSAVEGIYTTIGEYGLETVCKEIPRWLQEYTEQGSGDDITVAFYYKESVKDKNTIEVSQETNSESIQEISSEETSEISSEETSEISSEETSEISPEETSEISPEEAPEIVPELTQETSPEEVPEIVPELIQETSPEEAPEIVPELTQETSPEEAPEIIPKLIQETSLKPFQSADNSSRRMRLPPLLQGVKNLFSKND